MALDIAKIRNIGIVGHGGVGKTSLVEGILFAAGVVNRLGRVDDGTTTTDFDPDEIKRKISLSTAAAFCDYKGHRLNFVDTPGYGDFISDARAGLRAVGAAVVVVDAVAGVQVQTEKVWKMANDYGLPRIVVINRMDRERADFFRTLESLQRRLKGRLCPLQVPIGSEAGFQGVVDLVTMKALLVADGKARDAEIPGEAMDTAKAWREKLTEAAAETDDDLLAKYLEEGSIAEAEMLGALRKAIAGGTLVPVLAAAATRLIGVQPLMDLIVEEFPSPADIGAAEGIDVKTKAAATRAPEAKAPFSALVFKTISDPHVGKLSVFRVYSGTLKADSQVFNATRGARERVGHIGWLQGKTQKPVEALGPGEIGVVAKLKDTLTGDTLSDEAHPIVLPGITFPEPAISFAIQPKTRGDEDKISTALHRMAEEDPTLHHHFDPETKQLLVSGMGQMHVEMVVERMKRKYNVDVLVLPPAHPLQGDGEGARGGAGQVQEADGRARPVRRHLAQGRAAHARRRVRVRGRHLRRRHPAELHPVRGEGRARLHEARHLRRLPGGGPQGHALRRLLPRRGLVRHGLPDRRVHGPPEGLPRGAPHPARAGHERGDHRALRPRGRCHRRHQRPPRPDGGHGARRRGGGGARPGADGGDAHLRVHPALDDGRPRRLLDGVLALRGGARPHRGEGRQGSQGGEGEGARASRR